MSCIPCTERFNLDDRTNCRECYEDAEDPVDITYYILKKAFLNIFCKGRQVWKIIFLLVRVGLAVLLNIVSFYVALELMVIRESDKEAIRTVSALYITASLILLIYLGVRCINDVHDSRRTQQFSSTFKAFEIILEVFTFILLVVDERLFRGDLLSVLQSLMTVLDIAFDPFEVVLTFRHFGQLNKELNDEEA